MRIPLVDLKANYLSIKEEIDSAIHEVIDKTAFIGGPFLEKFEEEFARKIGAKYCVFCSSGTSALQLANVAANKDNKKEAITVSNTFVATAESFPTIQSFIDVNEENFLMNLDELQQKLWPGNSVIVVPVHLFGNVLEVDKIPNNVKIIEDAAQCHFGKYEDGSFVGSKNLTCFSFFPGKSMGSFGDSGAVVTSDEQEYEVMKMYRNHGRKTKFESDILGSNLRGDAIQAAILSVKLKHILDWNNERRRCVQKYNELLGSTKQLKTPTYNERFAYHLYVVRELSGKRDDLKKYLQSNEIECGIHYPVPIHKQPAFSWAAERELPVTEILSKQILSLPIFPELENNQIEYICNKIKEYYK